MQVRDYTYLILPGKDVKNEELLRRVLDWQANQIFRTPKKFKENSAAKGY